MSAGDGRFMQAVWLEDQKLMVRQDAPVLASDQEADVGTEGLAGHDRQDDPSVELASK